MNEGKMERRTDGTMKNGKVYYDYRDNILIDKDNPVLAFKANRDRYKNKGNTKSYAGMPMLGSIYSEDAMTWNVFRTLQKENSLRLLNDFFEEDLTGAKLLLWTYALTEDEKSAKLQYAVGDSIRKIDGRQDRKQITEPDVILVTGSSFIVCECKLGEPDKCTHLWANSKKSRGPKIRYNDYFIDNANPFKSGIAHDDELYSNYAYQLFRMAFYSYHIAAKLNLNPKLISLTNETWWDLKKEKTGEIPSQVWAEFCSKIESEKLFTKNIFWQDIWLSMNCKKKTGTEEKTEEKSAA